MQTKRKLPRLPDPPTPGVSSADEFTPDVPEDLVGKVCVCSTGRIAIVTGRKNFGFGDAWVGLGLDGKGTWASTSPVIVSESGQEFHDKIMNRFGGFMMSGELSRSGVMNEIEVVKSRLTDLEHAKELADDYALEQVEARETD